MQYSINNKIPFHFKVFFVVASAIKYLFRIIFCKQFEEIKSFSQNGEDIILEQLFSETNNGFFVDVGCNHPINGNNTFRLYLKGWHGINIDGNHKLISLYGKIRPNDTSIRNLISDKSKVVNFYLSNSDKVSTISQDFYHSNKDFFSYPEENVIKDETKTLTEILNTYHKSNTAIDLLCVDVEGVDYEVLLGLDFSIYKPKVILVEDHDFEFKSALNNKIFNLLTENGYSLKYFFANNCIYCSSDFKS